MSGEVYESGTVAQGQDAGRQAVASRMKLFLQASAFDFVLTLLVSVALVFTVSYGFNSAPDLRGNIALIGAICAVLLACLYAGSWSKRMVGISAVAYVVVGAVVVASLAFLSPEQAPLFQDGQLNDSEGGYAVFGMVAVVVPAVVFLLSRRTWGVAVLLFGTALACGLIQFLYRDWVIEQPGTIATVAAFIGIGALFVFQGYRQGILRSNVATRTSFGTTFAFGLAASVACVALGACLFFAFIDGLGLKTVDVKLFEDYYAREVVEYEGAYDQMLVEDPDFGSSTLSDELEYTSADAEGDEGEGDAESGGGFALVGLVQNMFNPDSWSDAFEVMRFDLPLSLLFLLWLLPIVLIVAIVLLRRYWRTRRIRKIEMLPLPERAVVLYDFFLKRFKRLKVEKGASLTPLEFAFASRSELAPFAKNRSHTDFLQVTLAYQRAVYGGGTITDSGYRAMRDYYDAFFTNARSRMSAPKWWFWGFWRI